MKHAAVIPVEVVAIEQITPIIKRFTLRPVVGELPPFSGGCHIVVVMRGRGRTIRNPYSLCSSPRELSTFQIAVRRLDEGRGGSLFMHNEVVVGTQLEISHPVNLFPLAKLARKHILVAGGVGITPIMAMIDDLRCDTVPWELHFGVRGSGHDALGLDLKQSHPDQVRLYYESAGQLIQFDQILADQPLGTHVYTCGPSGMIDGVSRAARTAGWPDSKIHYERFAAPPTGQSFRVFLARSQLHVHVSSEQSLMEAIEAAGVDVPYLCRGGVCGQCETRVVELDGELIHNDHWLSAKDRTQGNKIMPCVSRACGARLVLDL